MAADNVHRDLRLTTPFMEGPDVEALQRALNKIAGQFPRIVEFQLLEDGKLGEQTLQATMKAAHVMGLVRRRLNQIERTHVIAQPVQRVLREPRRRSAAQKQRGNERRKALRKKLDKRLSLQNVRVTPTAGKTHWGGANDVMADFVEPFLVKRGLPLARAERTPAENAAVGGSPTSDHLTTHTRTAARDFPTFAGEDDARALAEAIGFTSWQPNSHASFTFSAGGHTFRAQILWGAAIRHGDHVHVGISAA